MHYYELSLLPTPAQAVALTRLGHLQRELALLVELDAVTATPPGASSPDPESSWTSELVLSRVLDDALVAQMRAADQGPVQGEAPRQPALTGAGLVTLLTPGFVAVTGIPGPIAAGTGDPTQLPRWAREVLGWEYAPAQPGTLMQWVPTLQRAQRVDWADIRQEPYGWVLELEFDWADYPAWGLSWMELHDRPHDETLRRLMV